MIRERNGVISQYGGTIEVDDGKGVQVKIRVLDTNGFTKEVALALDEADQFASEIRGAVRRGRVFKETTT